MSMNQTAEPSLDAERARYEAEDEERKKLLEDKNALDQTVYQVEKLLKESGEKLPDTDKKEVEDSLAEAKAALSSLDAGRIKKALDDLNAKSHKMAEHLYKQGSPAPGQAPTAEEPKKEDNVIDAEVVN